MASTFLADRAAVKRVGIYVQRNIRFRLPKDDEVPVIMVGPGTGIAPFRAFLEERRAIAARGRNWLFFGDRHQASDFLYRDELERFRTDGDSPGSTPPFRATSGQGLRPAPHDGAGAGLGTG